MIEDSTEIAKVRANLQAWLRAFNDRDIQSLLALYDEDSVYANAGAPLLRGVEQIRPWYEQAFATIGGTLRYKEENAIQDTRLAMLLGIYYFEPPQGQRPVADAPLAGRVALVYRRNVNGEWKLLFDMDNNPPDVSARDFG